MRKGFIIGALVLVLGVLPGLSHASTSVSISLFHNDLAPYGRWANVAPYGSVWIPAHVAPGWRPYTNGYWTYTDYGWTWVSYEPFGRDVYHYGRWAYAPSLGWVWIPDTVWAPAWVAWQEGDDYIGWGPLPPASRWGSSGIIYSSSYVQPTSWVFVERPYFLNRHIKTYVVPATRNVTILHTTRDVTRFDVVKGKPVNRGVDLARVESTNGRKVAKTYTSRRQNVRTQKRVPATEPMGGERRHTAHTVKGKQRQETIVANRSNQNPAPQKATKGQRKGAAAEGKDKGKGKP